MICWQLGHRSPIGAASRVPARSTLDEEPERHVTEGDRDQRIILLLAQTSSDVTPMASAIDMALTHLHLLTASGMHRLSPLTDEHG
jgi:hypothetical protein